MIVLVGEVVPEMIDTRSDGYWSVLFWRKTCKAIESLAINLALAGKASKTDSSQPALKSDE